MKKLVLILTLAINILLVNTIFAKKLNEREIFYKARNNYIKFLPKDFKADVINNKISNFIKTINKDDITKGKKPEAKFYFHSDFGERIVIENVKDEVIKNRFQQYIMFYNEFRPFYQKSRSYSDFTLQYEWKIIGQDIPRYISKTYFKKILKKITSAEKAFLTSVYKSNNPSRMRLKQKTTYKEKARILKIINKADYNNNYIIKMKLRRHKKGNYYKLFFSKKNFLISKAYKYITVDEKKRLAGYANVTYSQHGKHYLPNVLYCYVNTKKGKKRLIITLTNYKLNAGLKESDFYED